MVPLNGTTYFVYNAAESKDLKLGLLELHSAPPHPSTPSPNPVWAILPAGIAEDIAVP